MPHRIQPIYLTLLLSILLSSCTNPPQDSSLTPIAAEEQTIFHLDTSALAYGIFETEADSVTLEVSNTIPEWLGEFGDISIQAGSNITIYNVEPGDFTIVHSLPPGEKRVTITAGGQTKSDDNVAGVFVRKIVFDGAARQVRQTGKQIVVYGDSLAVGGNVDHLSIEAWPVLLRKHYPVSVEAYSYRSLYDDSASPEKRAELVSRISAWEPEYTWLAIGANDYGLELWRAAEFGAAYAEMLDAIHSANPQTLVFAQSPIRQAGEVANSLGDSLNSYRQQISAACLARAGWCIFVDGTENNFPRPRELYKDGVHLTAKSSAKYAETVLAIISQLR